MPRPPLLLHHRVALTRLSSERTSNYTVTTTEYWSQSYATTTTVTAPPGGTATVIIREPQVQQLQQPSTGLNLMLQPPLLLLHQEVPLHCYH